MCVCACIEDPAVQSDRVTPVAMTHDISHRLKFFTLLFGQEEVSRRVSEREKRKK